MGKCLSCLRANPPHTDNLNHHHSRALHHTHSLETPKLDTTDTLSNASALDGRSMPPDTPGNGGSKTSIVVLNIPEKKPFYSCIPPLTKAAGYEVRRLSSKEYSESKINNLFDHYKDEECDAILSEGIESLCADLDVKPDDFKVLVLAWKFKAEAMCKFTRTEFVNGCKSLRVDSIKGIQSKFPDMLSELQDPEKFKDLYRFTFKFGLDVEAGQRILPSDMAIVLWRLVFIHRQPSVLKRWLAFLEKHPHIRGIPRDTWNMFLNFVETIDDDLGAYDDTEAWPSIFDDFVEHENDKLNQNISIDHEKDFSQ